jgi:hypothetical protein
MTFAYTDVATLMWALRNYNSQLRAEIKHPTRPHGPAESAMSLADSVPLSERIERWIADNSPHKAKKESK